MCVVDHEDARRIGAPPERSDDLGDASSALAIADVAAAAYIVGEAHHLLRGAAAYGDRHDSALVLGGVVGYNLPAVRPAYTDLRPGDAVAFATDGIDADYSASLTPGLSAQRLAERILERHARDTDDALAAVVRYVGR